MAELSSAMTQLTHTFKLELTHKMYRRVTSCYHLVCRKAP